MMFSHKGLEASRGVFKNAVFIISSLLQIFDLQDCHRNMIYRSWNDGDGGMVAGYECPETKKVGGGGGGRRRSRGGCEIET